MPSQAAWVKWHERRLVVDIVEFNTVLDVQGKESLRQVVLWRWREWRGVPDYYVVDWKMRDKCSGADRINGQWVMRFDGREVRGRFMFETVSNADAEVLDRNRLPTHERR